MLLRYIPPIKKAHKPLTLISFFVLLVVLIYLNARYGRIAILIFSFVYAISMLLIFISLSLRHYLKLDEENEKLTIQKLFRKKTISIEDIVEVDLVETEKSYMLTLNAKGLTGVFSLSGSISFEEPPFIAFLRALHRLKPDLRFGDYCLGILQGRNNFTPWSQKMYVTYWTYILSMVLYYVLILLFVNILT